MFFRSTLLLLGLATAALANTQELTPLFSSGAFTYINGKYHVLMGNVILTSSDLKHWERFAVPLNAGTVTRLAFGNGTYLLTNDRDTWVSSDLIQFQSGPSFYVSDLIFDGTRFLVTGDGIKGSNDGLVWSDLATGYFASIAHGDSRTVAVGANVAFSDGEGFTVLENSPHDLLHVAAIPGLMVATDRDGLVTFSNDGIDWSFLSYPRYDLRGQLFGVNGKIYADNGSFLLSSSNGSDWSIVEKTGYPASVIYDGKQTVLLANELSRLNDDGSTTFIAFGREGSHNYFSFKDRLITIRQSGVWSSSNAQDWVNTHAPFATDARVASDDVLIIKDNDLLYITTDGINWQTATSPTFIIDYLVNTPVGFIMGKSSPSCELYLSQDGITWSPFDAPCIVTEPVSNGDIMLAQSDGQILRSSNMIDWEPTGFVGNVWITSYNGLFLLISNANDEGWLSPDGLRFERKVLGNITSTDGFWRQNGSTLDYSSDGRSWANSEVHGYPRARWRDKIIWESGPSYLSDMPDQPLQQTLIPWVVENKTWQSRIVLNNAGDTPVQVDLEAIGTAANSQTLALELAPGEVWSQNPADLFPNFFRYSLFINAYGSSVFPVFQVNANIKGVLSPSQSGGIFLDTLTPRLLFPFMAGEDSNALVIVETNPLPYNTRPIKLQLFDEQGTELATAEVRLNGRTPVANEVVRLFPGLTLPAHFSIRATGGNRLAGTAFIFNKEGQPSMANAFSLPH